MRNFTSKTDISILTVAEFKYRIDTLKFDVETQARIDEAYDKYTWQILMQDDPNDSLGL